MVNQLSQHSVLSESAFPTSVVLCLFFYGKFFKKSTNNPLPEKNGKKKPSQTFVKMYSFVSEHCHAEREREREIGAKLYLRVLSCSHWINIRDRGIVIKSCWAVWVVRIWSRI